MNTYTVLTLTGGGDVYLQNMLEDEIIRQINAGDLDVVNEPLSTGAFVNIQCRKAGSYIFGTQKILKEKITYEFR